MAVVSASHGQCALPRPKDARTGADSWDFSVLNQPKALISQFPDSPSHQAYNDALTHQTTTPHVLLQQTDTNVSMHSRDNVPFSLIRPNAENGKNNSVSDTGSLADSLLDLYNPNPGAMNGVGSHHRLAINGDTLNDDESLENSRWIHRDKLAQIESQELQAAGIVLPRSRAPSKASSQREHSKDFQINHNTWIESSQKRQRIDSLPMEDKNTPDQNLWDLRLPEEAAAEYNVTDASSGVKGMSRIPVCKKSPLPIPAAHLERNTVLPRKKSISPTEEDEGLLNVKTRERSNTTKANSISTQLMPERVVSESSIAKKASATRPAHIRQDATNRPNTRSGSNTNSTATRNIENKHVPSKRPEGDPPWLSSMYKPDPRLPPDQQLLPTIAKRLQQEQWEKEGKFGNIYDTSLRPLNDQSPATRPILSPPIKTSIPENQNSNEWPLQSPKNSNMTTGRPGTAGGYSTMPKIIGAPPSTLPVPNAKPLLNSPEPHEIKVKKNCGCCVIM